jgi:hypothetical protein
MRPAIAHHTAMATAMATASPLIAGLRSLPPKKTP